MANEEQLAILMQGVKAWNKWRGENPASPIDLQGANLVHADLQAVVLEEVSSDDFDALSTLIGDPKLQGSWISVSLDLTNKLRTSFRECAMLQGADLRDANLRGANLRGARLERANLQRADLSDANLDNSELSEVDLGEASLRGATLRESNLSKSNLNKTLLIGTDLSSANLWKSDLSNAHAGNTVFADSDWSQVLGLESVLHFSPSTIPIGSFARSQGKIPEPFLRGCGLPDWEIQQVNLYKPDLSNDEINKILYKVYDLRASQAFQISPLFISYSRADSEFVDKISGALTRKGIRYWRDIHEMKAGRIEKQIDAAISQNPTVLLVLSEHSIMSDWVEHEVRMARALEKETGRDVFCPVALDSSWQQSPWPQRVMEQIMEYNILDFSAWQDDSKFDGTFRKLIDGLQLFYEG